MNEWKEYRLGDVGVVITGKTPSSKNPEDFGSDVPFVTPTDYRNYRKTVSFADRYLSHNGANKLKNKVLPTKSVMVTCIGSDMGKVAMNSIPVVTNQQINSIVPDSNKVNPDFLYYKLVNSYDILRSYGLAGTALPIVNKTDFENISIMLVPLPEQQAIASVLSSLDDKIDLLHRQNKTLEGIASALWRKMFVEDARPDWKTMTIGDVVTTNGKSIGKDYPYREIEYLDTGSITEGNIAGLQHLFLEDAPSRARRIVQENDIAVSMVRPIQKHYGILKNVTNNTVVSTGFVVITCREIDPHFLYLLLTQEEMTEYLEIVAEGSTTTYPSLIPSDIEKIEFQMPPVGLMQQFSGCASDIWSKVSGNYEHIRILSRLRDTLLPKLMSGEVRVKL